MTTRTTVAASSLLALIAFGSSAFAQSQAALAEKANEEGKELMYEEKYEQAADKFRDAAARTNEPKYFFNLCTAFYQAGRFSQALTACNNVKNSSPTPEQTDKADKLLGKINEEAKKQNIVLEPAGGGGGDPMTGDPTRDPVTDPTQPIDPTNPDPGPGPGPTPPQPVVGARPSGGGLFMAVKPDNGKYVWSLGAELFGGGGKMGSRDVYGTASAGFRLKSDYMLNSAARLGAQGYLQYTQFSQGDDALDGSAPLSVVDIGGALFKHLCPPNTSRLCLTPLVGVHIALMNPDDNSPNGEQTFEYAALGGRAELAAHVALGRRNEHVIGVALGASVYTRAFSGPSFDSDGMDVALDEGGVSAYLSAGYTYRFNTPFGRAAFVTLE